MRWLDSSDVEGGPGWPIRALLRSSRVEGRVASYDRRKLPVLRLFTQDNATVRLRHDVGGYLLVVMVQKGDTNFGNTILYFFFQIMNKRTGISLERLSAVQGAAKIISPSERKSRCKRES